MLLYAIRRKIKNHFWKQWLHYKVIQKINSAKNSIQWWNLKVVVISVAHGSHIGLPMVLKRSMVSPIDHDLLLHYVRFFEWAFSNEFTSCSKCYFRHDKSVPASIMLLWHLKLGYFNGTWRWYKHLVKISSWFLYLIILGVLRDLAYRHFGCCH